MAKRNKKLGSKKLGASCRNWFAVSTHFATGGGIHADRRFRRKRTRRAQNTAAIAEY